MAARATLPFALKGTRVKRRPVELGLVPVGRGVVWQRDVAGWTELGHREGITFRESRRMLAGPQQVVIFYPRAGTPVIIAGRVEDLQAFRDRPRRPVPAFEHEVMAPID